MQFKKRVTSLPVVNLDRALPPRNKPYLAGLHSTLSYKPPRASLPAGVLSIFPPTHPSNDCRAVL